MKAKRMTHTHRRFLLSYLLFACVFLFTYIPIYNYAHGIIYRNVCNHAKNVLARGVTTLDTSVSVALNTYAASSADSRFLSLKYANHANVGTKPIQLSLMVEMLRYSLLPGDLITDAGICRSSSWAITNKRSFYSDAFYSFYPDFLACGELSYDEWAAMLLQGGTLGVWLPEMQYTTNDQTGPFHAIAYARVWFSYSDGRETPTIYFALLNTDALMNILENEDMLEGGYLVVEDSSGNVLLNRGVHTETQEILTYTSEETGFKMELGLSQDYLYHQLEPLESMIVLYIVVFSAVALVLVLVFSHRSAAPMQKLLRAVNQAGMMPQEEKSKLFGRKLQQDYEWVASGINCSMATLKCSMI